MAEDSNVVLFPTDRIKYPKRVGRVPRTIEEIHFNLKAMNHVVVDKTLEAILPSVLDQLEAAGFNVTEDDKDAKSGAFLVESFRSLLLKQFDISHPFQQLAEKMFQADPEGNLHIVNDLSIDVKMT